MSFKILFIIGLSLLLGGCSSMKLSDFDNTTPKFVPENYFNGKLTAYGLVKDMSGKIIRTFKGDLVGSWDENGVGTLDEKFVYNDGEKQTRVWTLKPTSDGKYIGTAGDIIGDAVMSVNGNTVMMDYTMKVPYNGSTINLNVKDWLHLQEDGVIINHSKMKKFGITVGELVITIIKDFPKK
ncbi:DUF3833 domain-containing protein [Arcobacter sp. CECT 8985]|uniref:DUF3833 domain-containing protein n=1 Tax=Arcobacter sp. CECT 8985 TaxID=1935424 RepID=UPI00100A3AEF|nr:DUF3833 domain-containing protein [Arcobacter sp. CECT 8985]RXJ86081.1 hypothetical protein CRU93_10030 [Arcobacter sp. CECT 8985]